jgi:hypothetical protein
MLRYAQFCTVLLFVTIILAPARLSGADDPNDDAGMAMKVAVEPATQELVVELRNNTGADQLVYLGWRGYEGFRTVALDMFISESTGGTTDIRPQGMTFVFGGQHDYVFVPLIRNATYVLRLAMKDFDALRSDAAPKTLAGYLGSGMTLTVQMNEATATPCPKDLPTFHCWRGTASAAVPLK